MRHARCRGRQEVIQDEAADEIQDALQRSDWNYMYQQLALSIGNGSPAEKQRDMMYRVCFFLNGRWNADVCFERRISFKVEFDNRT